jgi:predicted nucleic acid-binding protein
LILVDTSVWVDHLRSGDAHLLAAARLSSCALWSRDRRLAAIAAEQGIAFR